VCRCAIDRTGKVFPWNLVRLKNSCEFRHLFHRDIDAIDFARVYSRWCRTTTSAAFHISAKVTINVGFRALMLTSHANLAARGLLARYRPTTLGGGVGGSARNIWNQCVPRGHIVNRALRCWRLSTWYYSVPSLPLFLLSLRSASFFHCRARDPRKSKRNRIIVNPWNKSLEERRKSLRALATKHLRYTSKLVSFVL